MASGTPSKNGTGGASKTPPSNQRGQEELQQQQRGREEALQKQQEEAEWDEHEWEEREWASRLEAAKAQANAQTQTESVAQKTKDTLKNAKNISTDLRKAIAVTSVCFSLWWLLLIPPIIALIYDFHLLLKNKHRIDAIKKKS